MSFCPNTFIVIEVTVYFANPSDVRHLVSVGASYQTGPSPAPFSLIPDTSIPQSSIIKTWPINSSADIAKTFVYVGTLDTGYTMPQKYRSNVYKVTRFSSKLPQWGYNTFQVLLGWNESAFHLQPSGHVTVRGDASVFQYSGDGIKTNPYPKIITLKQPFQVPTTVSGNLANTLIPPVYNFTLSCDPTTTTTTTTTTATTPSPVIVTTTTRRPTTTPTPVPTRKPYTGVIVDCYTGYCKNLNF